MTPAFPDKRDPDFQLLQAQVAFQWNNDPAGARRRVTFHALKGHVKSQHLLGVIAEEEKAYRTAAKWYRLAAWQGQLPAAQYGLATLYYHGHGVKRDLTEAAKWMRLAAEGGDADGQHAFGIMCLHGEGVPEGVVEAFAWFTLANAEETQQLKATLSPKQLAKAERLVTQLRTKVAKRIARFERAQRPKRATERAETLRGLPRAVGSFEEWRVEYEVQRLGERWRLFVKKPGTGSTHGPTDAGGIMAALDDEWLDIDHFISDLRDADEPSLTTLANEIEMVRRIELGDN